jgi:hypothetical protein
MVKAAGDCAAGDVDASAPATARISSIQGLLRVGTSLFDTTSRGMFVALPVKPDSVDGGDAERIALSEHVIPHSSWLVPIAPRRWPSPVSGSPILPKPGETQGSGLSDRAV